MTKKLMVSTIWAVVLLLSNSLSAEPPNTVTQQGRIMEQGAPVNGNRTLTFEFLDQEESIVLSESMEVVVVDGFYSVELGALTTLDDALLRDDVRQVVVKIDDTALTAVDLTSVPFALVAKHLEGGTVVATSIAVGDDVSSGIPVVDGSGNWTGEGNTVPCEGCVDSESISDGSVGPDDLAFAPYHEKQQLYMLSSDVTLQVGQRGSITARCADDNDIPLQGNCPGSTGDVLLRGNAALDWLESTSASGFQCTYENADSLARTLEATIICIDVP